MEERKGAGILAMGISTPLQPAPAGESPAVLPHIDSVAELDRFAVCLVYAGMLLRMRLRASECRD